MRSPVDEGQWQILDEVASTQDVASELLKQSDGEVPGVIFAYHQTRGRGRFKREWHSEEGMSLTMSLVFRSYSRHPRPWLIGMAVAIAVADATGSQVRWPNDIHLNGKKLGGILTEVISSERFGKVPVIGVGINLNQTEFPNDLALKATSIYIETGEQREALDLAGLIVDKISGIPEPDDWSSIEDAWSVYDDTPGKSFRLPSGEEAVAVRVGNSGELVCLVDGEERSVLAGEAIFGSGSV